MSGQSPKIEIDDLHPRETSFIESYKATWEDRGLIAYAYLEPIDERPERGYVLESTYRTVSGREPGPRQHDQGVLLTVKVREYMTRQMIDAGWQPIPIPGTSRMGWQHESRLKRRTQSLEARGDLVVPKHPAPVKEDRLTLGSRKLDQVITARQAEAHAATAQPRQVEQDQTGAGLQQRTLHVPAREGEKRSIKSYSRTIRATDVTFTCARCRREATRSQYPGRAAQYCETCAAEVKREKTRERVARLRAGQKTTQTNM